MIRCKNIPITSQVTSDSKVQKGFNVLKTLFEFVIAEVT